MPFGALRRAMSSKAKPVMLQLHVKPGSRTEGVGYANGVLEIRTRKPAREGEANKDVVVTVADLLGIPKSSVELVRGHKDREKTVAIHGLGSDEIASKLSSLEE